MSIIAVTNKHTAKLHHVGSLYILTYDARKLKHNIKISKSMTIRATGPFVLYPMIRVTWDSLVTAPGR